ncbi:hypothetical protein ACO22_03377 [Paracoccidioides brasiliensis]|uniref:Uncharacterized protein n=1 Tax=Paracoccidioides brasiliensis TaxID=121759 RepID=A0A1D2JG53_PARBR|nr:hypothetical protein ACO22_03377 [Paracoccidioides brasiliensis]
MGVGSLPNTPPQPSTDGYTDTDIPRLSIHGWLVGSQLTHPRLYQGRENMTPDPRGDNFMFIPILHVFTPP